MMPLFWIALWSMLPLLALLSGPDHCTCHESTCLQNMSPLLESLQCHNDYESYIHCKWRKHRNTPLFLWLKIENKRKLCVPYTPPVQEKNENVQCRYKTNVFSIGISHTVFFDKNETLSNCSSVPRKPLDVSQHLRARPPVDLSTHDASDGGQRLNWSSPYPSSSPLNKNLTYQLSYRTDRQDWTTEDVTNTSIKLEKHLLLLGHRYEARVRARASVGQWSDWSPLVTWETEENPWQVPSLQCVLDGEKEVMCSWEVSRELAHFITYQLASRQKQTAPTKRYCSNPIVRSDTSGTVLRYSCSLTVTDPAHLLLELLPKRNVKTFKAYQHIRPNPPQQVTVKEKGRDWIVAWTAPSTASKLTLYYQVCYYRTQEQEPCTLLNISDGSVSFTLRGASLAPSKRYQIKVRSLVFPGEGSRYEGIPSEWSDPVGWISHAAPWSLTTLIYVLISVFVATVFFILYCTIPACQRKIILWVDSVPSPGKSKILSEFKSATGRTFLQCEDTSICKVLYFDTVSTCSSEALLWSTTDTTKKHLDPDDGFCNSNNFLTPTEKVKSSETSSMSLGGPYIICQTSKSNWKSVDVKSEEKEKEEKTVLDDSGSPVNFSVNPPVYGKGYVCLPNCTILISHSDANTNTHRRDSAEQDQQCPDTTLRQDKTDAQRGFSEATSREQPLAYTSGPLTPWPQGGTIQASGYCQLPQP
ncbi:cytokine receptor common subunit beta [Xiphias gladius]|uniref:cytokine receptor common subunit beta n=1 Tax=Xiphias gladius TaxID=8245 RepID=UPI001A9837A0|nr:cytokine receptor common subunit beta [Xiphias gladius]XP_040010498.1 cytokine receptor common subunit beta [Xiphias gladius]XP_040010506.1 cytokine receptor common subunit beta [Xiphias gladius]